MVGESVGNQPTVRGANDFARYSVISGVAVRAVPEHQQGAHPGVHPHEESSEADSDDESTQPYPYEDDEAVLVCGTIKGDGRGEPDVLHKGGDAHGGHGASGAGETKQGSGNSNGSGVRMRSHQGRWYQTRARRDA